jgi:hypothetical protein
MLSVTCGLCRKSGQVPEAFAGKRIKCVACGHRFLADSAPTPEVETSVETAIPEEFLDLAAPVQPSVVSRTTEIDVFVTVLVTDQWVSPSSLPKEKCSHGSMGG